MSGGQSSVSQRLTYRRVMLQRAVELSKEHGGLKRIPAKLLEENGVGLQVKKGAVQAIISFPEPEIMERRIAKFQPSNQNAAKEVEGFKLPSEPTPRAISQRPATMEDFWIEQGWYVIDSNGWKLKRASWEGREDIRLEAVRFLIDQVLQKDPREVTQNDFYSNKLRGVLSYYSGSPYKAISKAFPELGIKAWEMDVTPRGFYEKKENRIAAVKWLVAKLGKDPRKLIHDDFQENKLGSLLNLRYSASPHLAVSEAFPELDIKPWEMSKAPSGFYNEKENCIAAVKWLVQKLGKDPRDMELDDFHRNGLGGLMSNDHHGNSPFSAVSEAFPELDIKPWEMKETPHGFYTKKENRAAAVRWLVQKLEKDPRDLKRDDFDSNRLGNIMNYCNYRLHPAVAEAFPEIKPWEMEVTPRGFYEKKENRIAAVKWLVQKLGKDPRDVTKNEFQANRMGGLICDHYGSSPFSAVSEAFPELGIKAWEMKRTPQGFYSKKETRVAAVRWLVDKLGKKPEDIQAIDFRTNRLRGLLSYYSGSPRAALLEAELITY